jgi:putative transposase
VTSKSISTWKNEFIENEMSVFNKSKELKNHKNELDEKEDYIDKLHGKVGQLTLEVDWLKKKSDEMDSLRKSRK